MMTVRTWRPAGKLSLVVVLVSLVAAAGGFVAATLVRSPGQVLAASSPPERTPLTELVTSAKLSRTMSFDGIVEREHQSSISSPAVSDSASDAIVSRLPVKVGDSVAGGALIAEVSGRPVIVLAGRIPAFRAVTPGAVGADVSQLQRGLALAGYPIHDREGVYGSSTESAVARMYSRHGYEALQTGVDELRAADDALRSARRTAEQSQDPTQRGYAYQDLARVQRDYNEAAAAAGPQVPPGEIVFVPELPAIVTSIDTALGARAEGTLVQVASGRLVVRGSLEGLGSTKILPGTRARLLLTPGGQATGVVQRVESPADAATATDASAEGVAVPTVTVISRSHLKKRFLGTPVRLVITVAEAPTAQSVVPISAIRSSGARTWVTTVAGARRTDVAVTVGFLGDGEVQVLPVKSDALRVGDRVLIGIGG